jgi:hypothetical protein
MRASAVLDDCVITLSIADVRPLNRSTFWVTQECVFSPILYSLFTHDCMAKHDSNTIMKFADDTTVVGLIIDNDETA